MAAITRWVQYAITASGIANDGRGNGCVGTRGYSIATADIGDTIDIGPTTNLLHLSIDGGAGTYITLYSGTGLDPRFVARDITEKIHQEAEDSFGGDAQWAQPICTGENTTITGTITDRNGFVIRSGTLGSSSSVTVATSGTNSAHTVLGFASKSEAGGAELPDGKGAYTFTGTVDIGGSYYGFFDEVYKVVACNGSQGTNNIGTVTKGGSNTYGGTMTKGGIFNWAGDITYVISINTDNGTTMGNGTGNVPRMNWTGSGGGADSQSDWVELLYPDYWYYVGKHGLMVKFTDAVFNTVNPAWTIPCYKPDYVEGTNTTAAIGTAKYMWSSDRGDDCQTAVATVSGGYTALGTRGLTIQFTGGAGSDLGAGDCYYVICSAPRPSDYNITSLNYGNVTVSTESDLKSVMFEVESGAVSIDTVKFSLQSDGSFSHHDAGNSDTYVRFGTVGPGNTNTGSTSPRGKEWWPNLLASDIDSDSPPSYLYATEDNLSVVATADAGEPVGDCPLKGMTSDPMWLNIKLGASETGANSTINYRLYFDYN